MSTISTQCSCSGLTAASGWNDSDLVVVFQRLVKCINSEEDMFDDRCWSGVAAKDVLLGGVVKSSDGRKEELCSSCFGTPALVQKREF